MLWRARTVGNMKGEYDGFTGYPESETAGSCDSRQRTFIGYRWCRKRKTRVLTFRIAYLIKHFGVRPDQILAVTFTNKAAQEMKERIEQLVGGIAKGIWVSTFHSTCVRILRSHGDKLGYQSNFQIFDSADQLVVIREILKELNLDPKRFDPRAMLSAISSAKTSYWVQKSLMQKPWISGSGRSVGSIKDISRL